MYLPHSSTTGVTATAPGIAASRKAKFELTVSRVFNKDQRSKRSTAECFSQLPKRICLSR